MHVDVRVVAATHQDLAARVAAGRFRDDLHARLRGHVVTLPPLRARRVDLGLLCARLLARTAGAAARGLTLQRPAARALLGHAWPHNVRELERALARAVALADGSELRVEHLPPELLAAPAQATPRNDDAERQELVALLRRHRGNVSVVAAALATSRSQLRRLLERHASISPTSADGSGTAQSLRPAAPAAKMSRRGAA